MHVITPFQISMTQMLLMSLAGSQTDIQAHSASEALLAGVPAGTSLGLLCCSGECSSPTSAFVPYTVLVLFSTAAASHSCQQHPRLHLFSRLTDYWVRLSVTFEVSKIPHQPGIDRFAENMTCPSVRCSWCIAITHRGDSLAYRSLQKVMGKSLIESIACSQASTAAFHDSQYCS